MRIAYVRVALIMLGGLLTGVAVMLVGDQVGGGDALTGRIALLTLGLLAIAAGAFGRHFPRLYRFGAITLANCLILFLVIELVAGAALRVRDKDDSRLLYADHEYYREKPWASAFLREHAQAIGATKYVPYVTWKQRAFDGDHIRIDASLARAVPAGDVASDRPLVMMLGGSAVWGFGVPDRETLPALLQAEMRKTDPTARVMNLGQNGYITTQCLIELVLHLQRGVVPDVVVLYTGANEVYAAAEAGAAAVPYATDTIAAKLEGTSERHPAAEWARRTAIWRLLKTVARKPGVRWSGDEEQASVAHGLTEQVVGTYLANVRLIRALGAEYGFRTLFIWQPVIMESGKVLTEEEQKLRDNHSRHADLFRSVYARMRLEAAAHDDLLYLGDALDAEDATLFMDPVHLNPLGNRLVARRIHDALRRN